MVEDSDELFYNDAIQVYPDAIPIQNLRHTYLEQRVDANGKNIDFKRVHDVLSSLKSEVFVWYKQQTGLLMDTYNLKDMLHAVQDMFWSDERFKIAFEELGFPYDRREDVTIPWWNEIACGELEHRIEKDIIHVTLDPRHTYETQLIRSGHKISIKSVSGGGMILTDDGFLVIGLRGGNTFPNTYHINAGALRATEILKAGTESIADNFQRFELKPEYGVLDGDVAEVTVHSRIMDYSIDRGPMYNFLVNLRLSSDEIRQRWKNNKDDDKKEHRELLTIPANPEAVNGFISENYVGRCENRLHRADNERYLLHPAALSLTAYSGMSISELRKLYRPGFH